MTILTSLAAGVAVWMLVSVPLAVVMGAMIARGGASPVSAARVDTSRIAYLWRRRSAIDRRAFRAATRTGRTAAAS